MSSKSSNSRYNKEWLESLTDDDFSITVGMNYVSERCDNCKHEVKYNPSRGMKRPKICPVCGAPFGKIVQ